ncbi:MAG: acetate/propionate family kinase [bacterium]
MILVINCGSTTLKFRVFDADLRELSVGLVDRLGQSRTRLDCRVGRESERRTFASGLADHARALGEVFSLLGEMGLDTSDIVSVGHRVVHGGEEFVRPTVVTREMLNRLRRYSRLAPLHNPANLSGIEAAMELLPQARQVAVFDTAFFSTLPDYAYIYALPWNYYRQHGIRKYGFHGISHRYVAEEAARRLRKPLARTNLITCHLGGGSSVTAVENGRAVDTSMGLTPLAGLTMATRCGDIDPSIPLFMVDTLGLSVEEAHDVLNRESGLKGLTGHADLREVLVQLGEGIEGFESRRRPAKAELERSRLAVDKLCYDVARYVGSYAALLGRVDAVVFTGGVGENSVPIRRRVMARLKLKPKLKTLVVPTNEELMIAREVQTIRK